jgi:hypothetical protein
MRHLRVLLMWLTAAGAVLTAQGTANGRFAFERVAEVTTGGQQRLDVDVTLLAGSQPFTVDDRGDRWIARRGLGDLRLFNQFNTEVPYLLIEPAEEAPVLAAYPVLPISAVDQPNNKTSGFEVDARAVRMMDGVSLNAIPAPFLKRFRLEGSGDRERWTELIREGTAFNLPAEGLRHTLIEFEPGEYRYLRITWDDTNSARVIAPAGVAVRHPRPASIGPILRSSISLTRRPSEPGRSRFRLNLPAARMPIVALELTVGGGHLLRDARVLEAGFEGQAAAPRQIGAARLTRVVRDTIIAESLRIPIRQPAEPQLELVVDDGDNPPLELEGVTAVFAELPWIYFESQPGPITVRYGDPKLSAPRYDLEAARDVVPASPNRAGWRSQPPITLAPVEEGLPMPDTGGAIGTEGFEYVRDIPAGAAGLIAVQMDVAAMAHSGRDPRRLRDVRVVDASGLQIPYLLEARDEPLVIDVPIERKALPDGIKDRFPSVSSYQVHLPFQKLPKPTVVLTTRARVFQRTVTIGTIEAATERRPARFVRHGGATWRHADQDVAAPPLSFPLPDSSLVEDVYLLVDEGDNQPLPIDKVTLLVPQYAVRLFRKENQPLRLLYGRDDLDSPRYDLQLLSTQVLGRTATEVVAAAETQLREGDTDATFDAVPPMVFWSVLGVTVLILLALVVRLMKREAM